MVSRVNAPARAPFLQTPESVIDDVGLTDAALRFLQGLVKMAPRNRRNSDDVAKSLRMGKDKVNAARKCLRAHGHWHARKRQNLHGKIRDQRLASVTPLRTAEEIRGRAGSGAGPGVHGAYSYAVGVDEGKMPTGYVRNSDGERVETFEYGVGGVSGIDANYEVSWTEVVWEW